MADEYSQLSGRAKADVDAAIEECRRTGQHADVGEAYAYPHGQGKVAWGYNGGPSGFNSHRGIK